MAMATSAKSLRCCPEGRSSLVAMEAILRQRQRLRMRAGLPEAFEDWESAGNESERKGERRRAGAGGK